MQYKHPSGRRSLRTIAVIAVSMLGAFALGIGTAGDVHPVINATIAGTAVVAGDMNGNGMLDVNDARIALELAEGFRTPEAQELAADPNQDFQITAADAMTILEQLERLPGTPSVRL